MIHQITSETVCHSLSFNSFTACLRCLLSRIIELNAISSWLIVFRKLACFPASYLIFAASYRKRKEKVKLIANSVDSIPWMRSKSVLILAAIQLCTDGNHQALRSDHRVIFFSMLKSIRTFMHWIIHQVISGIKNNGNILYNVSKGVSKTSTLSFQCSIENSK